MSAALFRKLVFVTIPFAIVPLVTVVAQVNPDNPTFEVASIKRNTSGDGRIFFRNQPGRYTATNVTLKLLILSAYRIQNFQISGGPAWMDSDHFDIVAKADSDVLNSTPPADPMAPTPIQLMVRALLADRFKMVVHTETKDLPVYALVVARKDGRLGPEMHKSDVDCAALAAARGRGSQPAPPPGGPPPSGPPRGGSPQAPGPGNCGIRVGMGNLSASAMTLPQLANSLAMFVERTVLDKTGLTGGFDFTLSWTPDQMPNVPPGAGPASAPGGGPASVLPPAPADGPSIYTALQEQLGLKLESQRGPVEILIIDRAEHPTEN